MRICQKKGKNGLKKSKAKFGELTTYYQEGKMDPELLRKKRWFKALEIAEILFEDEGYHIEYLKDIEEVLRGEDMYSPKIQEDLIPELYRKAKAEGVPMTEVVDRIIRKSLNGGRKSRK